MIEVFFEPRALTLTKDCIYRRIAYMGSDVWIAPMYAERSMVRRNIRSIRILLDQVIPTWKLQPIRVHNVTEYINMFSYGQTDLIQQSVLDFLKWVVSRQRLLEIARNIFSAAVGRSSDRVALSRIFQRSFINRLFSM
jgi:hypothetical protein